MKVVTPKVGMKFRQTYDLGGEKPTSSDFVITHVDTISIVFESAASGRIHQGSLPHSSWAYLCKNKNIEVLNA